VKFSKFDLDKISCKGKIICATTRLEETFFEKSILLITDAQRRRGAKGYVLNDPTGSYVKNYLHEDCPPAIASCEIYRGGPVEETTLIFAAFYTQNGRLAYKFGLSNDEIATYSAMPGAVIRAFAGHAEWVPMQLEFEVMSSSWFIFPQRPDVLNFMHDKSQWRDYLRSKGPYHAIAADAPYMSLIN